MAVGAAVNTLQMPIDILWTCTFARVRAQDPMPCAPCVGTPAKSQSQSASGDMNSVLHAVPCHHACAFRRVRR
jgi:hypothetical protein